MNLSKICKTHINLCIQTPTLCTVSKNDAFLHLEMMPFCIWIGTARWVVVFSVELLELRRTKGRPDFFLTPPPVRLWSFCDKSACAKKSRDFLAHTVFERPSLLQEFYTEYHHPPCSANVLNLFYILYPAMLYLVSWILSYRNVSMYALEFLFCYPISCNALPCIIDSLLSKCIHVGLRISVLLFSILQFFILYHGFSVMYTPIHPCIPFIICSDILIYAVHIHTVVVCPVFSSNIFCIQNIMYICQALYIQLYLLSCYPSICCIVSPVLSSKIFCILNMK